MNINDVKQNINPPNNEVDFTKKSKKWDDQILWTLFKDGDEAAFIILYQDYCNLLFNYGCQFCQDQELIKDCLQDFFVYLREKRNNLGDTTSIKLYLMKAFKRRVIDYLKKHQKQNKKYEEFMLFQFPIEMSSEDLYIKNQFEAEEIITLKKALGSLELKEREAIYYFYYEKLTYEQIAKILEFTHVSSARRLIYRALGNLRKFILLLVLGLMVTIAIQLGKLYCISFSLLTT
jgi:RNA polymerase sigma factor (sigma-70 family)